MNAFNTNEEWQDYTPKCEFRIKSTKDFSIIASSFWVDKQDDYVSGWNWNVYAIISPSHPLYSNDERLFNLPFNCGCTYDKLFSEEYIDTKYSSDNGRIEYKKLGSDYAHIDDSYDSHQSPQHGIPAYVLRDALELIEALETWE